jgi:GLPGLI family protein
MKKILLLLCFCISLVAAAAQELVSTGTIEYEVKTNIYKTMGDDSWSERMKDNMSKFKTGYYTLQFSPNQSLYKFERWDAAQKIPTWYLNDDENAKYFFDNENDTYNMQKSMYGFNFVVKDTIPAVRWKLENETQVIAGYTCRKATGVMMDSVYIFAFYTDQIMSPTGPCSIGGLPGTILGMTIPRLFSSWIATKVTVTTTASDKIKPIASKKYYTTAEILKVFKERAKEWAGSDAEDIGRLQRMVWGAML